MILASQSAISAFLAAATLLEKSFNDAEEPWAISTDELWRSYCHQEAGEKGLPFELEGIQIYCQVLDVGEIDYIRSKTSFVPHISLIKRLFKAVKVGSFSDLDFHHPARRSRPFEAYRRYRADSYTFNTEIAGDTP